MAPAALFRTDKRLAPGVCPIELNIHNRDKQPTDWPVAIVKRAKDFLSDVIALAEPVVGMHRSKLTYQEVIDGVEHNPYLKPMEMRTSEGYPLNILYRPKNERNKSYLFKKTLDGKFKEFDPILATELTKRQNIRAKGGVPTVYYQELMKDNKIDIAKVPTGKGRIFSVSSVAHTLEFNQYFGLFKAAYSARRPDTMSMVGCNLAGPEAGSLVRYMEEAIYLDVNNPGGYFTGDYSKFGDRLQKKLVSAAFDVIINWYEMNYSGKEPDVQLELYQRDRRLLAIELLDANYIVGNTVFKTLNGIPSGSPLTVELNNIVNSMLMLMCWMIIWQREKNFTMARLDMFQRHVRVVCYGDDLLVAVSGEALEFFNGQTVQALLQEHNIDFTNADKDKAMPKSTDLSEVTFLKRKFVKHPFRPKQYLCPLPETSIIECLNWVWKGSNDVDIMFAAIRASLQAAHGSGEVYYNNLKRDIIKAIKELGNPRLLTVRMPTWQDLDACIFEDQDPASKDLWDGINEHQSIDIEYTGDPFCFHVKFKETPDNHSLTQTEKMVVRDLELLNMAYLMVFDPSIPSDFSHGYHPCAHSIFKSDCQSCCKALECAIEGARKGTTIINRTEEMTQMERDKSAEDCIGELFKIAYFPMLLKDDDDNDDRPSGGGLSVGSMCKIFSGLYLVARVLRNDYVRQIYENTSLEDVSIFLKKGANHFAETFAGSTIFKGTSLLTTQQIATVARELEDEENFNDRRSTSPKVVANHQMDEQLNLDEWPEFPNNNWNNPQDEEENPWGIEHQGGEENVDEIDDLNENHSIDTDYGFMYGVRTIPMSPKVPKLFSDFDPESSTLSSGDNEYLYPAYVTIYQKQSTHGIAAYMLDVEFKGLKSKLKRILGYRGERIYQEFYYAAKRMCTEYTIGHLHRFAYYVHLAVSTINDPDSMAILATMFKSNLFPMFAFLYDGIQMTPDQAYLKYKYHKMYNTSELKDKYHPIPLYRILDIEGCMHSQGYSRLQTSMTYYPHSQADMIQIMLSLSVYDNNSLISTILTDAYEQYQLFDMSPTSTPLRPTHDPNACNECNHIFFLMVRSGKKVYGIKLLSCQQLVVACTSQARFIGIYDEDCEKCKRISQPVVLNNSIVHYATSKVWYAAQLITSTVLYDIIQTTIRCECEKRVLYAKCGKQRHTRILAPIMFAYGPENIYSMDDINPAIEADL
jgi:hypothetical protein